ncbi:MAG: hypothetical protein JNL82_25640 [Myxococcales bacterium]|nr:hypothetical protein [Myxococcales bacterium]
MPSLAVPRLCLAASLAGLVYGLAGPAAAQMPVKSPSSPPDALPPMPAPQPVQTTPPDVSAVGSSSAATGVPTNVPGPAYVAPPPATSPARPEGAAPAPTAEVHEPRRRAWGQGTTLINREAKIGVYAAPTFTLGGVNRSPGFWLGADFGVLLGERFALGVAGRALVTPLAALRSDGRTFNLRMPYAGVTLAVALVRVKFFSIGVSTLLGGGRVCLNDERLDRCVNRAAMFVAEPELGFHFALTKYLRLVISGGYRVVVAQAWSGPENPLLRGLTGTIALRLGKF